MAPECLQLVNARCCVEDFQAAIGLPRKALKLANKTPVGKGPRHEVTLKVIREEVCADTARDMQSKLPAGRTIWAWVDAPFRLDFGRNRIWHFHHDWFIAPWSMHVRSAEELRQELVARNVDYILWQYRSAFAPSLPFLRSQLQGGEWVEYRVIHQNTMNLLLALQALANNSFDTIYADDRTVLISLRPPTQARPPPATR
jgi:hypothetical protein